MAYIDVDLPALGFDRAVARVVTTADRAWRGYNRRGLNWREQYYAGLLRNLHVVKHSARVIDYLNERTNTIETCAFIFVLKLREDAARRHLGGRLSEYEFASTDVAHPNLRESRTFHYIQSVFVEVGHRQSPALFGHLISGFFQLLKAQRCGVKDHPYTIYAETDVESGQRLALRYGFTLTSQRSIDNCELYELPSENSDLTLNREIRSLW